MSYGSGMDGPPDAIAQAARALAAGHALLALKAVALRKDARGSALRGIALAQLGEYPRARALLRRAARAFGARAPLDRARCLVAEAEVRLAMRDLGRRPASLDALARRLARMGDVANARQARLVEARWALLTGRLAEARGALAESRARSVQRGSGPLDLGDQRGDTRRRRCLARVFQRACRIPRADLAHRDLGASEIVKCHHRRRGPVQVDGG
ncbi:MAG TPA: hypothetical protein VLT58_00295, partial [Polyangia bacterium]|nr:hypothetical protein [Polyangia bacterium]